MALEGGSFADDQVGVRIRERSVSGVVRSASGGRCPVVHNGRRRQAPGMEEYALTRECWCVLRASFVLCVRRVLCSGVRVEVVPIWVRRSVGGEVTPWQRWYPMIEDAHLGNFS